MLVQNFRQEKKTFFQNNFFWDIYPVWSPQKWIFMAIRSRTLSLDYHISRKEICKKCRKYLCFGTYSNGRHHMESNLTPPTILAWFSSPASTVFFRKVILGSKVQSLPGSKIRNWVPTKVLTGDFISTRFWPLGICIKITVVKGECLFCWKVWSSWDGQNEQEPCKTFWLFQDCISFVTAFVIVYSAGQNFLIFLKISKYDHFLHRYSKHLFRKYKA